MAPQLHYLIARARQQEIATRAIHARHCRDTRGTEKPRRPVRHRLLQAIATLGVGLAAVVAVTVSGAYANPHPTKAGRHISAQQFAREIHALETKGYQQASCAVRGMLMRNDRTGQSLTVAWQ